MKCVKVSLKEAENAKNKIIKLGVFDNNYGIARDKSFVYFPVTKLVKGFKIVEKKLKKREVRVTLKELLKNKLNEKEFNLIAKSYDIIGDIAVLEIEEELLKKKKVIADALLKSNKNIKTVVRKVGEHKGEYRLQDYEFLDGEKKFEALHKESGISLKLDIRKTYYSPRSSNERLRISGLIKKGEDVLVMFSGIGIYCFVIAKHSIANEIYGVEINPNSCKYANFNVKLNKIKNVKLFCGDVRKVLPKLNKKFDRIIMPLPKTSLEFLDLALKFLNKNGIIHLYCFSTEEDVGKVIETIKSKCDCEIFGIVKAGQQSPKVYRYCIDFRVL